MNKEVIIKLLKDCISSNSEAIDKKRLQDAVKLLSNINVNVTALNKVDFEKLKNYCQMTDEEIQELMFYMIMCELEDEDYQLTQEQIKRIRELVNKYLKEIKERLELINKNLERDNYLNEIIMKINQDDFILSSDELRGINKLLKDKNVDILQVNQVMISLGVAVISQLEKELDEKKVINNVKKEVEEKDDFTSYSEISRDKFIYELDELLSKYNFLNIREVINNDIDILMKETTLNNISDVLKTLHELNINLNVGKSNGIRIRELMCHSSGEVIKNVLKLTVKLSGYDEQWCFKYLFQHIAIFVKDGEFSAYQDFIKNMYMLEELGVTSEQFMSINGEVLCINHKILRKNILTLEKYKIPRSSYLSSTSVLKTTCNISDELDMWLELGNYETEMYLKNRLSILVTNKPMDFGSKLRIFKDLGINITINDTYRSLNKKLFLEFDLVKPGKNIYLNGKRYVVNFAPYKVINEEYDNLMKKKEIDKLDDKTNNSEIYQKFINSVECVNDLYYYIPGVSIRISKNKVYRVFNNLINSGVSECREMLLYAITYNSVISQEEYNKICQYVEQLLEHKGSVR